MITRDNTANTYVLEDTNNRILTKYGFRPLSAIEHAEDKLWNHRNGGAKIKEELPDS